jgi:hypothetical protein
MNPITIDRKAINQDSSERRAVPLDNAGRAFIIEADRAIKALKEWNASLDFKRSDTSVTVVFGSVLVTVTYDNQTKTLTVKRSAHGQLIPWGKKHFQSHSSWRKAFGSVRTSVRNLIRKYESPKPLNPQRVLLSEPFVKNAVAIVDAAVGVMGSMEVSLVDGERLFRVGSEVHRSSINLSVSSPSSQDVYSVRPVAGLIDDFGEYVVSDCAYWAVFCNDSLIAQTHAVDGAALAITMDIAKARAVERLENLAN